MPPEIIPLTQKKIFKKQQKSFRVINLIIRSQILTLKQEFLKKQLSLTLKVSDVFATRTQITETYGVPVEQIREGIKNGVRKVNIDTDLRLASTGAIRRFLAENPTEFDPRKYLAHTITAMKDICKDRYEAFGTAGNAGKIKVKSLERMQSAYDAGELTPKVN